MSHDELSQIKKLITDLDEKMIQQRSSHHSDLLKQILELKQDVSAGIKKIDENTTLTTELRQHPIFKAWDDGKTIMKFMKWGGIALIGLSTLIVAIKNGGSILKEYAKLIVKL
jgi:hypothetical protein